MMMLLAKCDYIAYIVSQKLCKIAFVATSVANFHYLW